MKQLLQDAAVEASQEQRALDQKIVVDRETEFYLTDAEIEEVLHPKLMSTLSLERRIEQVLSKRSYDDFDTDEELQVEEIQLLQPRKGQQRKLPRKNNSLFKKESNGRNGGRNNNKRVKNGGGRGNKKIHKRGKRGDNKRGKRGKRGGNKHQVFKYTNKQYKNICLSPPDR